MSDYTPIQTVNKPESEPIQDESRHEKLINRLLYLFGDSIEHVNLWLSSPHPCLGRTPISYLEEGKIEAVESLVGAIEYGIPD